MYQYQREIHATCPRACIKPGAHTDRSLRHYVLLIKHQRETWRQIIYIDPPTLSKIIVHDWNLNYSVHVSAIAKLWFVVNGIHI